MDIDIEKTDTAIVPLNVQLASNRNQCWAPDVALVLQETNLSSQQ